MSSRTFDRETILDLTVNFVPLVILGVFIVTFVVYAPGPFAFDSVASTIQLSIVGTTFVGLAVLTYYMGKAIAGNEKRLGIHAQTATYDAEAGTSIPSDHEADAPEGELPEDESAEAEGEAEAELPADDDDDETADDEDED